MGDPERSSRPTVRIHARDRSVHAGPGPLSQDGNADERRETPRGDDPMAYMTSDHSSPYLFESQMDMIGRMGRGATPRRRFFARLFAVLALLPFLIPLMVGVIRLVR